MQAMLLAARPRHTPAETAELQRLCAPGFDWTRLLELSVHHSLIPLVHTGLSRSCPDLVPPSIHTQFAQRTMSNALRAFRWMQEAARLSEAMRQAGYPVLVLKGVPLSQQLYGSPHLRQVGDIDLLTSPASVGTTLPPHILAFQQLGYRRINPPVEFTPRRIRSYTRFWKDLTFHHDEQGFDVDLHWRFFNHTLHPANRLLLSTPDSIPLTALGATVDVLPMQEQFLHVAAHGVSDAWIYLKSLADVAGFLAIFTPTQLEAALARAEEIGLLPEISAGIHLSNSWMGSDAHSPRLLPVTHALVSMLHSTLSALLQRHNFRPTRDDRTPTAWVSLERAQIPGIRSLAENLRRFLWRPRVWKRFDLPDRLFWLYPVLGLILPPRADSIRPRRTRNSGLKTQD